MSVRGRDPGSCSWPARHIGMERWSRQAGRNCLFPETEFWHSKTDGSPRDRVWHPRTYTGLVSFDFISNQFGHGRASADHPLLLRHSLPSLARPLGRCCAGVALLPTDVTSVIPRRLSPVDQHCTAAETPGRVHGSTYSPLERTSPCLFPSLCTLL